MSGNDASELTTVIAHVNKHITILRETKAELDAALTEDVVLLGKTPRAGVLVAGLLENYYTCAETIFVRISRYFENNLQPERWHSDLLDRMVLEIEGIRPRVLSDAAKNDLAELMRFRHFRRYYFGTDYDWTRLEELILRVGRAHDVLCRELQSFVTFLRELNEVE